VTTEQTLAELQQTLAKAWVAGDRTTIESIIAPEWTSTGPDGTVATRAQVLADVFERHAHRIQQVEIDGVRVRVFGDAAIVTGRTHGVGSVSGTSYDVNIRFTDVFVRRGNHWQAVTSHASLLSPVGRKP
jgi:ketosteroid isomerase-like protein